MIRPALVAAALCAALPAAAQTFPRTLEGRCPQGACARTELLSREEAARSPDGVLWRVRSRLGTPGSGNRIRWRSPAESYVFCSTVRPAYLFHDSDGPQWTVHLLAPGYPQALSGFTYESQQAYNYVCHGVAEVEGPAAEALAGQGYPASLAGRTDQFDVTNPQDILRPR